MLGHCVGNNNENTVNYLSKAYKSYFGDSMSMKRMILRPDAA